MGLGAVLSQQGRDGKLHPVAYASRSLSPPEKRYAITELETLAVVWAISHFLAYLYGHDLHVYTDHSAVKAVLETPSPSGKHARWWSKVFGSGVRKIQITYRAGKENANADALSRCPKAKAAAVVSPEDSQVSVVQSVDTSISELLQSPPACIASSPSTYSSEQDKDPEVFEMKVGTCYLRIPSVRGSLLNKPPHSLP